MKEPWFRGTDFRTRSQKTQARQEAKARIALIIGESRRIVRAGTCPQCGTELRRNLALAGWWQCGAYGRPDFRKPEHRDLPDCSFQCFTE